MGFKYLWISAPELQSWTIICCRRQEGPWNGCVSQAWFIIGCSLKPSPFRAWVLFDFSGLCLLREWKKERKNTEKEMGSERRWRKERKKKIVKLKEKETFTTEDKFYLRWNKTFRNKKQVPLHNHFWKVMLSSCIRGKKKSHTTFFFFFVKAYTVQWITFFFDSLAAFSFFC